METRRRREAGGEEKPKRLRGDVELWWREEEVREKPALLRCDIEERRREAGAEEKLELRQSGDGGGTRTDPGGFGDKTEAGALGIVWRRRLEPETERGDGAGPFLECM